MLNIDNHIINYKRNFPVNFCQINNGRCRCVYVYIYIYIYIYIFHNDLESPFIVRSRFIVSFLVSGPNIQSGTSPSAGLQVATQSSHLSNGCYPQLLSNPHRSEIRPLKQLDHRCIPLHLVVCIPLHYTSHYFACSLKIPLIWHKNISGVIACTYNPYPFEIEFPKRCGTISNTGNSSSMGGWIMCPPVSQHQERSLTKC